MKTAIGIDIGGTNTKLALVNLQGDILARRQISTQTSTDVNTYFQAIYEQVNSLLSLTPSGTVEGIGIGAPSSNERTGTIAHSANLLFQEPVPIRDIFTRQYGVPAFLVKDANASALGEYRFGGARDMTNFALITLGTGLGCGIFINGAHVPGHSGLASELGHITVTAGGRMCGCGRRGCLETYVSATGIRRTAFELMANELDDSELRRFAFPDLTAHHIAEAATRGDHLARMAFTFTGDLLGSKIADLAAAIEPEAVFLSGGLAQAGDLLLEPTRRSLERNLLHLMRGGIQVLPSLLGANDAALLGAASLALYNHQNE